MAIISAEDDLHFLKVFRLYDFGIKGRRFTLVTDNQQSLYYDSNAAFIYPCPQCAIVYLYPIPLLSNFYIYCDCGHDFEVRIGDEIEKALVIEELEYWADNILQIIQRMLSELKKMNND